MPIYLTWPWWRRLVHWHTDPHWQRRGVWRYCQCACGARRVVRATSNLMGPVERGWPRPHNSHGEPVNDTGWRLSS